MLEEGSFRGRTGDFFFMLLLGAMSMTLCAVLFQSLNIMFLGSSLTFMMVYLYVAGRFYIELLDICLIRPGVGVAIMLLRWMRGISTIRRAAPKVGWSGVGASVDCCFVLTLLVLRSGVFGSLVASPCHPFGANLREMFR
jgi:hypothetical protein